MTRDEIENVLEASGETALFADGFDDAILGITRSIQSSSTGPVIVYDSCKCIEVLMRTMERDEAVEFFDFNVSGAYVGPQTPIFVDTGV
jgi:hypothetical protein